MAEIKVFFTLIGNNINFEEINNATGIQPTYTRRRDEILGNGKAFGHDEWGIETDWVETAELPDIVSLLKEKLNCIPEKLNCIPEKLKSLANMSNAEWHLLIPVRMKEDDIPALYFSKEDVSFFGAVGAHIGFDIDLIH